jgi:dsRNA-specific ribonuclease
MGVGEGSSRRAAETAAAAEAIDRLRSVAGPGPSPEGIGS